VKTAADFNFRELRGAGPIGEEIAKLQRAVRALLPVETPTVRPEMPGDGLRLHAKVGGSAPVLAIELTVMEDWWPFLICEDSNGNEFTVYSPIGLEYSGAAQGIYSGQTAGGGTTVGFNWADTSVMGQGTSNRVRRDLAQSGTVRQALSPGFKEGETVIYALKLASPVTGTDILGGGGSMTATHIDLNVGGRRWEAFHSDTVDDSPVSETTP
jgi:hypothetical protein